MTKILLGLIVFSLLNGIICAPSSGKYFYTVDSVYFVSTDLKTFIGAWLNCVTAGMQLATVLSEAEQVTLNATLSTAPQKSPVGYWIGGVDEISGTGSWYWLDLNQRISTTYWGSNQPNFDANNTRKQCIRVGNYYKVTEAYLWENVDCSLELPYICKQ